MANQKCHLNTPVGWFECNMAYNLYYLFLVPPIIGGGGMVS